MEDREGNQTNQTLSLGKEIRNINDSFFTKPKSVINLVAKQTKLCGMISMGQIKTAIWNSHRKKEELL